MFASMNVFGQCTPDANTAPINGVSPATVSATNNQTLSPTVLTVTAQRDSTFSFAAGPAGTFAITLKFTEFKFDSVTGFPAGLPAGTTDAAQATSLYATSSPSPLTLTFPDTSASGPKSARGCVTLSGTPNTTVTALTPALVATVDGYVYLPANASNILLNGFPPILPAPCPSGFANPFLITNVPSCITSNALIGGQIVTQINNFRKQSFSFALNVAGATGISELANNYNFGVYPNPATADSRVSFTLGNTSSVRIELVDVAGRVISTIANTTLATGTHSFAIANEQLNAGIYIVRASINGSTGTTKLVVR